MKTAQRLDARQTLKSLGNRNHKRGCKINQVISNQRTAKASELALAARLRDLTEPPEQSHWGDDSQPLIPLPAQDVMEAVKARGFVIGWRGRCERESKGKEESQHALPALDLFLRDQQN